jgi:hypothetical protein
MNYEANCMEDRTMCKLLRFSVLICCVAGLFPSVANAVDIEQVKIKFAEPPVEKLEIAKQENNAVEIREFLLRPLGKSDHSVPQDIGRGVEHLGREIGKRGQRIFGW